ncbi:beta-1,3-galactosyltransferase 5-like [Lineus longissimus]|uniref:beta-1,3-galactosyltransferase 5-like n=1 Tax=Lineus longissimus TaxID=88925 RepID=UPI002B4FA9B9
MKICHDAGLLVTAMICWIGQPVLSDLLEIAQYRMRNAKGRLIRPPPIPPKPRDREKSAIPESFFTAPLNSNPHNYTFLINEPKLCLNQPDIYLLILIRTIYSQADRRQAIRQTWANQRNFPNHQVILVFLFGVTEDKKDQRGIEDESRRYGDVVQEDFKDTYGNLTLKDVMAFKWAWLYCPHAKFVLVGSDEVVIDVFKLVPFLEYSMLRTNKREINNRFVLCHLYPCCTKVHHEHPKYGVSVKKYSGNAWPNYCSGTTYIVPSDVIRKLYAMSWDTPSFMPDDAWIGVLAEKLGLTFHDSFKTFAGIRNNPTVMKYFTADNYFNSEVMIGVLDYDFPGQESVMMKRVWQLILDHHKGKKVAESFWMERDRRSYRAEPNEDEHETPFSSGFLLNISVVSVLVFIMCYWLKKKRNRLLCRRCMK